MDLVHLNVSLNDRLGFFTTPGSRRPSWSSFRSNSELCYFILVLLNAAPIVFLAIYAPRLSERLANQGCLPNGKFVFPGTASVWTSGLFTISIPMGKIHTFNFADVKVIDLTWDTVVGRGVPLLLAYVAYRIFNQVLVYVMDKRVVGYATYGAVAFQTGSMNSIWHYLRAALNFGRRAHVPMSWRERRIFASMILTTAYIIAMPTMYSAMTSYAPVYYPFVQSVYHGDFTCDVPESQSTVYGNAGFFAGWGVVLDTERLGLNPQITIAAYDTQHPLRLYYERHISDYIAAAEDERCVGVPRSECPLLAKNSTLDVFGDQKDVTSPLLDIQTWGSNHTTGLPDVWLCDTRIVKTKDIDITLSSTPHINTIITCNAINKYQWGFSFLLLFIVCVLQFIWAAMMYELWIEARRNDNSRVERSQSAQNVADKPSLLVSAVAIVSQAKQQYGKGIKVWSSEELNNSVWNGSMGMPSYS